MESSMMESFESMYRILETVGLSTSDMDEGRYMTAGALSL